MSGKRKIGRDAVILTVSQVTTMLIALLSNMLLSRFRTIEEFGTYSQINIVISLSVAFFMFGLPSSVNYFLSLAEDSNGRKKFLSVYYTLTTSLCLLIGLLLISMVRYIEDYFSNPTIGSFAYFLLLYPWANVTISGISNVLVVYGRPRSLMIINVATAMVALFSVVFIHLVGMGFQAYMKTFLLGNILICFVIYILVNRLEGRLSVIVDKVYIKKIFNYAVPIGLSTLVGTFSLEIDKLMIGRLMGTEALALYANAGRELPLVFVASSLTAVLLPKLVRDLKDGAVNSAVELWKSSVELSFVFVCFMSSMCVVFAPQIVSVLYSDKYLPGTSIFIIYSLIMLWRTTYFGIVLNATGKTKLILWSSILALILNMLLNIIFYMIWGFVGPAIASFISIGVVDIIQLIYTCKILSVPFKSVFPWKELGVIFLYNAILGMGVYRIITWFGIGTSQFDLLNSVFIGLLYFMLYISCMFKSTRLLWKRLNN